MHTRTAAVLLATLLMLACAPTPRPTTSERSSNPPLAGTHWVLQALGSSAVAKTPPVTLNFGSDNRIGGNDGCNQYQGNHTSGDDSIRIGENLAGTLMACPDQLEAQARDYRQALQRAARFALDRDRLSLRDDAGNLLATFVPAVTSPVGTTWEVVLYNNGKQGAVSLLLGSRISASFGTNGRVSGSAGCNQYFAAYTLDGPSMRIGAAGATRRFCAEPDGMMNQERLYLEALQTTATFRLNGDRLELRTANGALAVSFRRETGE
ncbi:putative Heat shock protein [Candidatus Propionivibrio aalborgensis]|uniref:Putative Heat shock protein n=1 Tax=Candidatus Propionivibrio aalborgensis TaxID=1860101 RepID=A0A1A8XUI6_9RHOO|nr:META domain-containing protein [Candidatus Propionivibrio aalborgensis]MBK7325730.1 META domain-containing protein [Propionivibrio sp.]MBK7564160.1 META domain-containing protein [Propionivibrio sp.]MBK9027450.1 META domain-containing protein [Propionivibrio sp.]MBP6422058.1 META domain-containing protein [Propionivibrio sp.]SBT08720.1 putative Heat shock protein [Candidatus Propionivibrio aalborgensis]